MTVSAMRAWIIALLLAAAAGGQPPHAASPGCEAALLAPPRDAYSADCFRSPDHGREEARELVAQLEAWSLLDPASTWIVATRAAILEDWLKAEAAQPIADALVRFVDEDDARGEAYMRSVLANYRYVYSRNDEARAEIDRARELLRGLPDATTSVRLDAVEAHLLRRAQRPDASATLARRAALDPRFAEAAPPSQSALYGALRSALIELGEYSEALRVNAARAALCGGGQGCEAQEAQASAYLKLQMGRAGLIDADDVALALQRQYETAKRTGRNVDLIEALCQIGDWLPEADAAEWDQLCLDTARTLNCLPLATTASVRLTRAQVRRDPARAAQALRDAEQTLRAAESRPSLPTMLSAARHLAALQHIAGDAAAAVATLERVVGLAEAESGPAADPESRFDAMAARAGDYYALGWLQAFGDHGLEGGPARSFETMERLRTRSAATRLAEAGIEPSAEVEIDGVRAEITRVQQRLAAPAMEDSERRRWLGELERLEADESAILARRDLRGPARVDVGEPPVASIDDIRVALGDDEALLQFNIPLASGSESWVNVVSKQGTASVVLETPSLQRIQHLYAGMLARRDGAAESAAEVLSRAFLERPLATLSPEIRRLVVVADGALFGFPLSTLPDPASGAPLVMRYEIALAPSASLWLRLRRSSPGAVHAAVLGFAEPYDARDALSRAHDRSWVMPAALGRLPRSRAEIADVVTRIGGASRALAGAAASERALKTTDLSRYGVIHFATHAFANRERPSRSAVVLARGSSSEDGFVQPREIARLELVEKLVVLSTCESAGGALSRSEGPLSLARAFLRAGATAVIGTLWPVDDEEAAALMEHFYARFSRGMSAGTALREAQADLARMGRPAAAWAGYVLIGDGAVRLAGGGAGSEIESERRQPLRDALAIASVIVLAVGVATIVLVRRNRAAR